MVKAAIQEAEWKQANLSRRVLKLVSAQEIERKRGVPLDQTEEQIRMRLLSARCARWQGCLNELMGQMCVRPASSQGGPGYGLVAWQHDALQAVAVLKEDLTVVDAVAVLKEDLTVVDAVAVLKEDLTVVDAVAVLKEDLTVVDAVAEGVLCKPGAMPSSWCGPDPFVTVLYTPRRRRLVGLFSGLRVTPLLSVQQLCFVWQHYTSVRQKGHQYEGRPDQIGSVHRQNHEPLL
ncbi:hypothetical protein GWK47_022942 [Chionoecetes opilio]|uniref:Nucleoporin Nup54 alpha-helical domain-containing protein n=1 Tax=Chionoecetes opilio TaxID=41210 RepID=A0A8J5CGV7_CHIOP|nr:hypothetical protein GWK47_022942 [Chionoecetes opilio]